jgi:diacylglycerol kinase
MVSALSYSSQFRNTCATFPSLRIGNCIRQFAAFSCAATLAWEYFRDPSSLFQSFSIWALCVQFTYFQVPLRSKALPYLHAMAFIGATLTPCEYGHLLLWKPQLELNNMLTWEVSWSTIVTRSFCIQLAPLLYHTVDITANQVALIHSYRTKSRNTMYIWSLISFVMMGFIYEFVNPNSEETRDLTGISTFDFVRRSKAVSCIALLFSYLILYLLILRRAFKHES